MLSNEAFKWISPSNKNNFSVYFDQWIALLECFSFTRQSAWGGIHPRWNITSKTQKKTTINKGNLLRRVFNHSDPEVWRVIWGEMGPVKSLWVDYRLVIDSLTVGTWFALDSLISLSCLPPASEAAWMRSRRETQNWWLYQQSNEKYEIATYTMIQKHISRFIHQMSQCNYDKKQSAQL